MPRMWLVGEEASMKVQMLGSLKDNDGLWYLGITEAGNKAEFTIHESVDSQYHETLRKAVKHKVTIQIDVNDIGKFRKIGER